ncbi:MAG TPA: aminomethyltransferase family protein [Candidatus Limnocylindrales bacterium]|nr:aminomethyltransferase family protein [Candidatus Limnocylindrales bacterium]
MIRTTPFHERTNALNQTGLWEHWSNHLAAQRYQLSEKFEYFAIRNSAGLFDSSPLYKYRISGPDAERFLAGVMIRDIRTCSPGHAQYTAWCDDRGFVVEDGVVLRHGPEEFLLTAAEPNLAYLEGLTGRLDVGIEEVSDDWAVLAIQGPRARALLATLTPDIAGLPYFGLTATTIARVPVTVSRTGYTGDLGYEIWVPAGDALAVWDAVWATSRGQGVIPIGLTALYMARIEAGLVLLDVDFHSSRFAWTDADRTTPIELGLGWMVRNLDADDRAFIGRDAIARELREKTSRWRLTGLVVDWRDYDRVYGAAGLIPPKDHTPVHDEYYVYDDKLNQLGYATSQMYSPMLQRHIALARVPLDRAAPGSRVKLELAVSHRYEYIDAEVVRLPLFNPERRTA